MAIPWVGPRACPGLHFSDTGEPRGEAELPSGKKTEGTGPQGAPAGEAATSVSAPGGSRRRPRDEPVGSAGHSARSAYRERDVNPARFSAAARQERMERLRRDRAAAQAVRVAFPAVEHLRLELKFESTTSSTPTLQSHVLQCRRARGGAFEFQLQTQVFDGGERDAHCLRGCPVAPQALHALLACGGAETCRIHVTLPVGGSRGVAGASNWLVSGSSPRAPGRADRRCCFSCWRALRASSFCFLA